MTISSKPTPGVKIAGPDSEAHVYISGHVHYYKTKGLFKKEIVDETPFEDPCRKELEKWGRFTLVPDAGGPG